MKINFSEMTQRNACMALFLLACILEPSISPLLMLPLLLQEKRNLLEQIAEVKTNHDNNSHAIQEQQSQLMGLDNDLKVIFTNQDNCAKKSDFFEFQALLNSLERRVNKQQKAIDNNQHKTNIQQTGQNLMRSKMSKQGHQIDLLKGQIADKHKVKETRFFERKKPGFWWVS